MKGGNLLRTKPRILGIFFIFLAIWSYLPGFAYGDVEWTVKTQLNLKAPPLDVSESPDGKWLFILTPGEILIYSITEDRIKDRVPVDTVYDRLIHSTRSNTLILASRSEKSLKIVKLEMIHEFSMAGLPFRGTDNAPITIAVFSDYQ